MISVIIPVLNEAPGLRAALIALQPLRAAGHEIILADGGSTDGSQALGRDLADACMDAPRGRALQMNAAARVARGEILLFLHADTLPPEGADSIIAVGLGRALKSWGRFDVVITGNSRWFALIATMINLRSRVTGIATGDQAIFVRRGLFEELGGYAPIALMEDIELCTRLRGHSRPLCLRARVTTSGRRWEKHGIWRTILFMWWLRLRYFFGASPADLARSYSRGDGK